MGRKDHKATDRRERKAPEPQSSSLRLRARNGVRLDGSTLEGGGQLVRVALTLSALTGIPVHITKIRAGRAGGRTSGGLKESHLAALEVLAEECGASVQGGYVGSKELVFEPSVSLRSDIEVEGDRNVELQKPGSVWLILQALLPWYLFRRGGVELMLRGGTNVGSSMSGDYVQQVLLPVLRKIGLSGVHVDVVQRGWAGNAPQIGEVKVSIARGTDRERDETLAGDPGRVVTSHADEGAARNGSSNTRVPLSAFNVQQRDAISKVGITVVAHPASMRDTLVREAMAAVKKRFEDVKVEIVVNEDSSDIRRLYVLLVAHTSNGWRIGRDYLGTGKALKTQKDTDALGEGAVSTVVNDLAAEIEAGGCIDEYMQDQLVIFQSLATGTSSVDAGEGRGKGTLHTQTIRWVCQEMLGDLGFESLEGGSGTGIGLGSPVELSKVTRRANDDKDFGEELAGGVRSMNCKETNEYG